jgi:hypothetical protein
VAKAKDRWYVPDPNKAQDLEKKREKALLKEFETYKAFTGRKIKESRLEVLRAGFRRHGANKDYKTIISVANKLPEETLQEDEKLLLWYDQARFALPGFPQRLVSVLLHPGRGSQSAECWPTAAFEHSR